MMLLMRMITLMDDDVRLLGEVNIELEETIIELNEGLVRFIKDLTI